MAHLRRTESKSVRARANTIAPKLVSNKHQSANLSDFDTEALYVMSAGHLFVTLLFFIISLCCAIIR